MKIGRKRLKNRSVPVRRGRFFGFWEWMACRKGLLSLPALPTVAVAIFCHVDSAAPIAKRGDLVVFIFDGCSAGDLTLLVDQWGEAKVRRVKGSRSGLTHYAENPEYRLITCGV